MSPELTIEGRAVPVSNLDKVLYPKADFTKADVIGYYTRISPVLLPHLRGRALTLKRYPNGVDGGFFYEKECPAHRPSWVRTVPIYSKVREADIHFCVIDDLASLVWAANLADLELHTYLARAEDPATPTMLVFDLDPGPGTALPECATVGLRLREVFGDLDMESFAKTSGSKGLQVYVPLNTPASYEDTKPFARAVGELVEREMPDLVTTNMKKTERQGRVLVDWSQNNLHKTTVCAYSLRAKQQPTVSTPVTWDEVRACAAGEADLRFLSEDVLRRVEQRGDLFRPVLELEQALPVLD